MAVKDNFDLRRYGAKIKEQADKIERLTEENRTLTCELHDAREWVKELDQTMDEMDDAIRVDRETIKRLTAENERLRDAAKFILKEIKFHDSAQLQLVKSILRNALEATDDT